VPQTGIRFTFMAVLTTLSSLPAKRVTAAAVALLVFTSAVAYLYLLGGSVRHTYRTFPFSLVPDVACESIDSSGNNHKDATATERHVIPNIVHYVWLLKKPAEFRMCFRVFVSIYSAHLFWKPEHIYIHTDASRDVFRDAKVAGDFWTKRVLSLPGIIPHFIQAPNVTERGVEIVHMEHKADFLRMAVLRDFGGVYLDTDAVPLRDIAPLRNSGFANVLGGAVALSMKHSGYINNGVMMTVPQSTLLYVFLHFVIPHPKNRRPKLTSTRKIFYHAAHEFFDGVWETASILLLTDIANRLLPLPSEVLILHPQAFAPMSWELADQKRLFTPSLTSAQVDHELSRASGGPSNSTCRDALAWLRQREEPRTDARELLDFSSSYVLHAFDDLIRGSDDVIDVKYVLARQSAYARAVYPAVWHAVQAGIIPQAELQ
jgi:hypothetical protein